MKKTKFFAVLGVALSLSFAGAGIAACQFGRPNYQITINENLSVELTVGEEVDFTKYFFVTDRNGDPVTVTEDMLDLSQADTSLPGTFTVKISYGGTTQEIKFTVMPKKTDDDESGTTKPNDPVDDPDTPVDELSAVIKKYADMSKWSFAVDYAETYDGDTFDETYEYCGYNVKNVYTDYDDNYDEATYTDYISFNPSTNKHTFYAQISGSTYETYAEGTDDYEYCFAYLRLVDLTKLGEVTFTKSGSKYTLNNAGTDAEKILDIYQYEDPYEDGTFYTVDWTGLDLYISNGVISKIEATLDGETTCVFTFSKHGSVSFTLPNGQGGNQGGNQGGTDDPTDPTMMEKQVYNSNTFDNERLQDKIPQAEDSIGLPSIGTYHALVVPVQFSNDKFTQQELNDLDLAFNGTEAQTGWESVSTYYTKCSNNKLNLTFDIKSAYTAKKTTDYYEEYKSGNSYTGYTYGDTVLLKEVLEFYNSSIDFTDYDYNNDGMIDAVYLIYSAPIDYEYANFYWAFTTWYFGEETYDDCYAYYYFFAGVDFIYEKTSKDTGSGAERIPGLKINAETFIHETGHLLGLDDYYDTDPKKGSNEGLGGADMMDYNIGDHGVYSKIMLGWLDATVVNSTQTITIQASAQAPSATPSVLLIPLDFDNSYFSEYLLIDLYAATGLNEMHAGLQDTYLYSGAKYGVRIYHVSSSIENPYAEDGYGSFTDCNNSVTRNALIKLVEADGDKNFETNKKEQTSSGDCAIAEADDLWKAGDVFSKKFPSYARNDGKTVNFDIEIVSVSSTSATITVTFKN